MALKMEIIEQYFPELSAEQLDRLQRLGPLYQHWNQKINLISRKDIDNLYAHHILHSLAIARIIRFNPGAEILDLGTGGGLPGIPLAIIFPETKFLLVDSIKKKVGVVQALVSELSLSNVNARHIRAEELRQPFDFVVCRAVAGLDKLLGWTKKLIKNEQKHALPNGLITLKGGNIQSEIKMLPKQVYAKVYPLSDYFKEEYYREKYAVYVWW